MYNLEITRFIDAAHQLPDSESLVTKKCCSLHGHSYAIKVKINQDKLINGMVVDFGRIKEIIDRLDHKFINDVFMQDPVWEHQPTTAENIATYLQDAILFEIHVHASVSVCEGYKGLENSAWVTKE